jgi:hypothetical protein
MNEIIDSGEPGSDYRFFKFRAINKHLIDSLVMSHLWFAKPDTLNDPFDCQIDLQKSWARATSSATGERKEWLQSNLDNQGFFEKVARKLSGVGVCSFSLRLCTHLSTSVQWSHYADEHRGVCLLYRFPESFFHSQNEMIVVSTVTYEDYVLTNWLKNEAPMMESKFDEFIEGLITTIFKAKSPAWEYEHEVRIIRHESGLLNIPTGFLEQVCFGLRTPQADIDLVKKLAREHCGCKKFCQIICDDESDFGIKAVDI